jgi:hypothetical protein
MAAVATTIVPVSSTRLARSPSRHDPTHTPGNLKTQAIIPDNQSDVVLEDDSKSASEMDAISEEDRGKLHSTSEKPPDVNKNIPQRTTMLESAP